MNIQDERSRFNADGSRFVTRREWLAGCTAAGLTAMSSTTLTPHTAHAIPAINLQENQKAQIAITLDLEMSRNFPKWEDTFWDYEKGNLNEETKRYSEQAARRVKESGGKIHFFVVGRLFEQPNVDWLKRIVSEGHPLGNHTYDHVNVHASSVPDVQFRFRRSPWLVEGKAPLEIVRENVRLCSLAMMNRLEMKPNGFRTPGGFFEGLKKRPDVRAMLRDQGFDWVSSLYHKHAYTKPKHRPDAQVIENIVSAQAAAQPFVYPDGLIEIPMSPISDIGAFRTGQWKLEWFLTVIREAVNWAIENRATFDFLAHPSCLYVMDPDFKSIDLICNLVAENRQRAEIVDLDTVASRITQR